MDEEHERAHLKDCDGNEWTTTGMTTTISPLKFPYLPTLSALCSAASMLSATTVRLVQNSTGENCCATFEMVFRAIST